MIKKFLPLVMALVFSISLHAQNTFHKDDKVLNLGLGIGSTLYTGTYYTS